MSEKLLPPGTSAPIEVGFSFVWDTFSRWHSLVQQVKHIGVTYTPDAWVPLFIWDLGLEDILPYVTNMQMALAEGPRWQRMRGTSAGIEMGVGWVDVSASIDPPDQRLHWSQFQLELPETVHDLDHIKRIDGIARLSKAAEDSLYRLFNPVRDHRPIRMNRHRVNGGRFNGYSGERLWSGGPLISFAILIRGKLLKRETKLALPGMPTILVGRMTGRLRSAGMLVQPVPTQRVRARTGWAVRWTWDPPVTVRSQTTAI